MTSRALRWTIVALLILSTGMVGYIVYQLRTAETGNAVTPVISTPSAERNTDSNRAFLTLSRVPQSAEKGSSWTVEITSNTWSRCLGDVYDPDGNVRPAASPAEAEALLLSPGKFQWTWNVPRDAASGNWTVAILCGTFENLAVQEVSVRVE